MRRASTVAALFFVCGIMLMHSMGAKVFAATYTVTTTMDTADGACDSGCSLREAVIASNAGDADTIIVPAGRYEFTRATAGEDAADQGDLDFTDTDTTTVIGAGAESTIIDPNDLDRAFDILSGASVNISELSTDDSAVDDENGAALRTAGDTTISDAYIQNATLSGDNSTPFLGGGVYCSGGALLLTRVVLSGNVLVEDAAQMGGGGMAVDSACSSSIAQSTFSDNSAYHGGGIYYVLSSETLNTLTDTTLSDNTATDAGGGMVVYGTDTDNPVVLDRMAIIENHATSGAGIFVQAPMDMTNATLYGNVATDAGGAVGSNPGSETPLIRIAFSTLMHNEALIGGALYADSGANVQLKANLIAFNGNGLGTYFDCYGLPISNDYNYILNNSCSIVAQEHDVFDSTPVSYLFTALPVDQGGYVNVLYAWGSETVDIVPTEECRDASGSALTQDARGYVRPENNSCDRGAYEKDQTAPVVTVLSGDDTIACAVGTWIDSGATVVDNFSTGLFATTTDSIDSMILGEQEVVYVSDADVDGNVGSGTRIVTVEDTTAPELVLVGESVVSIDFDSEFVDPGALVSDACDQEITVEVTNSVDTTVPGTYTLIYTATDVSENTSVLERVVTVLPPVPNVVEPSNIRVRKQEKKRIVSWTPSEHATEYRLRITTKKGTRILFVDNLEEHKRILTRKWLKNHVKVGRRYRIYVKACNDTGCSIWSDPKLWRVRSL